MVRIIPSLTRLDRFVQTVARRSPSRYLLAAMIFVLAGSSGFAQLSGSYTVGTGQTYTTIDAFVSALNSQGVNGPVTATVLPGTYAGNITINAITGASSTNTVTIQGQNASTCIVEYNTSSTNSFVIRLNGSDYIRIRNLTINATGATYGYGVWLTNQADYNEVTGCTINVSPTSTSGYSVGVLGSGSSYSTLGNTANYNLIQNNTINGGYYGIRFNGTSSTTNCTGNQFLNNTIVDWYYYGIYSYYQSAVDINENVIADRNGTPYSMGLYLYYNRTAPEVVGNYVEAGQYPIYAYYCNHDDVTRGKIANNMLVADGIYNTYGLLCNYAYKMDIVYNSMNVIGSSGYTSYGLYVYNYSTSTYDVRNNVVRYSGTSSTACYFIYANVYSSTAFTYFDKNVFYHPQSLYYFYQTATYTSLASFQSARPLFHGASFIADPEYIGDRDLHTYSQALNGAGSPIASVTMDYDGDVRHATTPDIGADEYTLFAVDAGAKSLIAPVEQCGLTGAEALVIGIRNYGTATLNASTNPVTVTVNVTGPMAQSFNAVMSSGTIAPGATYAFQVTTALNLSLPGTYTFNATANAAGDGNTLNGAMKPVSLVVDKTVASFPYFEDFEAGQGGWRSMSVNSGIDPWQFGTPNFSGTYSINAANSGTKAWMTGLTTGYTDNNFAALISPCLKLNTLTAPVFQFFADIATEGSWDGVAVDASGDGGATWSRLTPYTPTYNYTSSSGPMTPPMYSSTTYHPWRKYVFLMNAYAGNPNVKVRILFGSDGSVSGASGYPGIAFDDPSIGDFYQKDISVAEVVYDNATNYWARRQNAGHMVHARIVNMGYEANPTSVTLTYKAGSMPASSGDGISQTFSPSWSGNSAWVTFSTEHTPTSAGPLNMYVRAFYTGDQSAGNDLAMTTPIIQLESVYGYEDFNTLTPPNWEKGWSVLNVNSDETWASSANGIGGTVGATYPGDVVAADDWLFTPGAMLLAGSSYSFDLQYRSRNGDPQTIELAFGPSPNPNSMTVFATYTNFTNGGFMPATNAYGLSPTFDTPNIEQLYYIGIHVKSGAGRGPVDIDGLKLYDNPFPPPKIAYGVFPNYIDDPTIPLTFTGVYKKTGLLTKTFEVVNSTGWYGDPDGDMLWDVVTTAPWINLIKSTPDPLYYLSTNPFNPPWCRQYQTFTMEVNANILPPGKHLATLDFDAWLYNSTYPRGIQASNSIFRVPVELTLSQAGGAGTNVGKAAMTQTGMDGSGNPYEFRDSQGNLFASVWVTGGVIPAMTITSYPGQLPVHLSRYRYVDHYWTIETSAIGWTADIEFHYFDSEVQSGGVYDEYMLRGMRIAPTKGFWEDPIMGTWSTPDGFYNYVLVQGFNDKNYAGQIAVAHDYFFFGEKEASNLPSSYSLDQNFPNPFNPTTGIRFGLPAEQHVTLTVINSMGEEVARLVDMKMEAGFHNVNFDARDLPSGMYLYRLTAGDFVQTRTMILNK